MLQTILHLNLRNFIDQNSQNHNLGTLYKMFYEGLDIQTRLSLENLKIDALTDFEIADAIFWYCGQYIKCTKDLKQCYYFTHTGWQNCSDTCRLQAL